MFKQIFLMSLLSVAVWVIPLFCGELPCSGKAFVAKVLSSELKAQKPTLWQSIASTICAHPYITTAGVLLTAYAGYTLYNSYQTMQMLNSKSLAADSKAIKIDSFNDASWKAKTVVKSRKSVSALHDKKITFRQKAVKTVSL